MNCTTNNCVVRIDITANTVFGARHALETIAQLTTIYQLFDSSEHSNNILAIINSALVEDSPKYSHRGLLIDTSRHYLPITTILRTIDAMAMTKLNVLHWHASDTQSFSLEIPSVPQLLR